MRIVYLWPEKQNLSILSYVWPWSYRASNDMSRVFEWLMSKSSRYTIGLKRLLSMGGIDWCHESYSLLLLSLVGKYSDNSLLILWLQSMKQCSITDDYLEQSTHASTFGKWSLQNTKQVCNLDNQSSKGTLTDQHHSTHIVRFTSRSSYQIVPLYPHSWNSHPTQILVYIQPYITAPPNLPSTSLLPYLPFPPSSHHLPPLLVNLGSIPPKLLIPLHNFQNLRP